MAEVLRPYVWRVRVMHTLSADAKTHVWKAILYGPDGADDITSVGPCDSRISLVECARAAIEKAAGGRPWIAKTIENG